LARTFHAVQAVVDQMQNTVHLGPRMYKIVFAFSCLTSAGYGQQVETPSQDNLSKALAGVLLAFNPGSNVPQGHLSAGANVFARTSTAKLAEGPQHVLAVCQFKTCKKDGAEEALETLRTLASTHTGIAKLPGAAGEPAERFQRLFADKMVERSPCYGACGRGPNVMDTKTGEMFHDVYKPAKAKEMLGLSLGLDIPDAAVRAYINQMKAKRALADGEKREALSYLDEALELAAPLRYNGVRLLHVLLESRAHVHQLLGNEDKAVKDRLRSIRMTRLKYRPRKLRVTEDAKNRADAAAAARQEVKKEKRAFAAKFE